MDRNMLLLNKLTHSHKTSRKFRAEQYWTPTTEGSKPRAKTVVSAREEFERVETDGGESERPIVSLKRGNHPEEPRGEKGTPCHDTVGGTHGGCIETHNRVQEPTTVAESGTRRIADSLREPSRSEFMI